MNGNDLNHEAQEEIHQTCPACQSKRVHRKNNGRKLGGQLARSLGPQPVHPPPFPERKPVLSSDSLAGQQGQQSVVWPAQSLMDYLALQQGALAEQRSVKPLTEQRWTIWSSVGQGLVIRVGAFLMKSAFARGGAFSRFNEGILFRHS